MTMTARITKRVVETLVRNLIADGYLTENPVVFIDPVSRPARFVFKDGTICLGARQALEHLDKLVRKAEES